MKRYLAVMLAVMIMSCPAAAGIVYAGSAISGEFHSLRTGKTSEFRRDGTVNWEGTEGKYILENDELIIMIGGNAQKYEIRFIDGQMILFDPAGYGEIFEKISTGNALDLSGIAIGDVVYLGAYEQDDDPADGPEEIEWEVLDIREGKALLLSKYALDCQPYSAYPDKETWEICSLREWLNNDFLSSAFSAEEKEIISLTALKNEDNPVYETGGGEDTQDQVFLLSLQDIQNYFGVPVNEEEHVTHKELIGRMTKRCRTLMLTLGAEFYENDPEEFGSEYEEVESEFGENAIFWWLRSPGRAEQAAYINYDGAVVTMGFSMDIPFITIRPAMWINMD